MDPDLYNILKIVSIVAAPIVCWVLLNYFDPREPK